MRRNFHFCAFIVNLMLVHDLGDRFQISFGNVRPLRNAFRRRREGLQI